MSLTKKVKRAKKRFHLREVTTSIAHLATQPKKHPQDQTLSSIQSTSTPKCFQPTCRQETRSLPSSRESGQRAMSKTNPTQAARKPIATKRTTNSSVNSRATMSFCALQTRLNNPAARAMHRFKRPRINDSSSTGT